jgi:hypothetical protein
LEEAFAPLHGPAKQSARSVATVIPPQLLIDANRSTSSVFSRSFWPLLVSPGWHLANPRVGCSTKSLEPYRDLPRTNLQSVDSASCLPIR